MKSRQAFLFPSSISKEFRNVIDITFIFILFCIRKTNEKKMKILKLNLCDFQFQLHQFNFGFNLTFSFLCEIVRFFFSLENRFRLEKNDLLLELEDLANIGIIQNRDLKWFMQNSRNIRLKGPNKSSCRSKSFKII